MMDFDTPLNSRAASLPANLVPLVGRDRELAELDALLSDRDAPVVTITGPGGCGKTTMALAAAARAAPDFPDGARVVRLARVRHDADLPSVTARALGLKDPEKAAFERVRAHLCAARLLLVLDNAEHLPAVGGFLRDLSTSVPEVKVLVTSRVPLGLALEREYALTPLALPEADATLEEILRAPAVELFRRRALAVRHGFTLTGEDALAAADIVRRLDGLPLAIELAATHLRTLSPRALRRLFSPTLDLLTGGPQEWPEHQRSMRATIAWSDRLLPEKARRVLRTLSCFTGGATLESLAALLDGPQHETLALVEVLVRHSLVCSGEDADGTPRFQLLEVIREYAAEQQDALDETHATRVRHAHHFLALARRLDEDVWTRRQASVLQRLERDHDNFRSALRFSLEHDPPLALLLASRLGNFWSVHGHLTEGRRWLNRALRATDAPEGRARATYTAGEMARMQGDHVEAAEHFHDCLALARSEGDRLHVAAALNALGVLAHNAARPREARAFLEQALPLWEAEQRDFGRTTPLFNLGRLHLYWGDAREAVPLLTRALTFWRSNGNLHGVGYALYALGRAAFELGDDARGAALLRESLEVREGIGDERGVIASRTALGLAEVARGDLTAARPLLSEALTRAVRLGHQRNVAETLEDFASLAVAVGAYEDAVRLSSKGQALREAIGAGLAPLDERYVTRAMKRARAKLSRAAYERARQEGQTMSVDDALVVVTRLDVRADPKRAEDVLTPRERQVVVSMAAGLSNREIARQLELSEKTVARHCENVFNKLGVNSRAAAAAHAIREGWA
ncbi:tetratricopeptide repeat protein [Deinococcus yavapaiensis]|uniref:Putative ATPase n=1 Tax=Deinococcus yavapaiensis KR-236 TaxID=694435 RepID=A0A318SFC8_9DEIO|nr:tetratricopeptide repeat protein [Deinococcus yavapaiensis]PYE52704.1 putative ATPase [Deinococcus yavapaiensis KR-236]